MAEALGARVVGEKFQQLVLEDAGAAWFEEDERIAGIDLAGHAIENLNKVPTGRAEQAEVIERASAADVTFWNMDPEAGLGKNLFGGNHGLRMVVVVPGVGPEQHYLRCSQLPFGPCGVLRRRSTGNVRSLKRRSSSRLVALRGQPRQLPFLRDSNHPLDERAGERAGKQCVGEGWGE